MFFNKYLFDRSIIGILLLDQILSDIPIYPFLFSNHPMPCLTGRWCFLFLANDNHRYLRKIHTLQIDKIRFWSWQLLYHNHTRLIPIHLLFKQPWTVMILEPQICITHPYFFFFSRGEMFFFLVPMHFCFSKVYQWPPFTTSCTERTYSSIYFDRTPLRLYLLIFPWWHSITFDGCVASLLYKGPSNLHTLNLEPRSTSYNNLVIISFCTLSSVTRLARTMISKTKMLMLR